MIGIYGGTFDPVHNGHLRTALEVKEIFTLDEVRLIPCSQPPHRESPLTTAEMRLDMLKLAIKNQPGLVIDRRELDRDGFSYMIDTLESLRNEISNAPLILFMGSDAFKGLKSWYRWQHLFDYAHIVVLTRPGYEHSLLNEFFSSRLTEKIEDLKQKESGYLFFQPVTQLDISATGIRNIIQAGLNPGFLLPDSVIDYIKRKKLYK
ncbi:MAG: nicotinate-nucleotide adenylyltransferase [Methylococcales bacterium]|nr:nicotinate-nucleotide adenylyltransferase [Methylococcales bacterium]MCK5478436.1 nicotinate-nucleotide adenylyltransferase [Methylococcales bacterium]